MVLARLVLIFAPMAISQDAATLPPSAPVVHDPPQVAPGIEHAPAPVPATVQVPVPVPVPVPAQVVQDPPQVATGIEHAPVPVPVTVQVPAPVPVPVPVEVAQHPPPIATGIEQPLPDFAQQGFQSEQQRAAFVQQAQADFAQQQAQADFAQHGFQEYAQQQADFAQHGFQEYAQQQVPMYPQYQQYQPQVGFEQFPSQFSGESAGTCGPYADADSECCRVQREQDPFLMVSNAVPLTRGAVYCGQAADTRWWNVEVIKQNCDGTYSVVVQDDARSEWPVLHRSLILDTSCEVFYVNAMRDANIVVDSDFLADQEDEAQRHRLERERRLKEMQKQKQMPWKVISGAVAAGALPLVYHFTSAGAA